MAERLRMINRQGRLMSLKARKIQGCHACGQEQDYSKI